ncbi:hypothetical protein [Pandoraea pnomenusa]|uniref:hypothetical protein n=1 Tax=Pandoraea pnomenusa TaxID=93220 RepID=UPI003342DC58
MSKRITQTTASGTLTASILPDGIVDIYADGIGPAMIGYPMTKLCLVQQRVATDGEAEGERDIVAVLSIPTHVLLEFNKVLISSLTANKEAMMNAIEQQKVQFDAL